jgi:hypothetical protein
MGNTPSTGGNFKVVLMSCSRFQVVSHEILFAPNGFITHSNFEKFSSLKKYIFSAKHQNG